MVKIKNKKKFVRGIAVIVIALAIIIWVFYSIVSLIISLFTKPRDKQIEEMQEEVTSIVGGDTIQSGANEINTNVTNEIDTNVPVSNNEGTGVWNEWNLKLVNSENSVSRDYVPEVEELDDGIKFDKRAISYLKNMINAMYKDKITGIWVASAYRSYDKQEELFNKKVKYYKDQGKSQTEAETLAQKLVQRPEMSEHNLGLAADFNTVSNEFEKTKAFSWLQKNAAEYGFVLRYPKDKQEITGISYESWHWRYVGKEHAKVMKEKGYCLEEYIEYLRGAQEV